MGVVCLRGSALQGTLPAQHNADEVEENGNDQQNQKHGGRDAQANQCVNGIAAGANDANGQADNEQDERILIPVRGVPEATGPMELEDGHQHTGGKCDSCQRGQQANGEEHATSELPQSTGECPQPSWS